MKLTKSFPVFIFYINLSGRWYMQFCSTSIITCIWLRRVKKKVVSIDSIRYRIELI
jgi:hypothetical protein